MRAYIRRSTCVTVRLLLAIDWGTDRDEEDLLYVYHGVETAFSKFRKLPSQLEGLNTAIELILRERLLLHIDRSVRRIFNWPQSTLTEVVTTAPESQSSLPYPVKSVSCPCTPNWGIVCRKLNCETFYSAWRNGFPLKLFICSRRLVERMSGHSNRCDL